VFFGAFSAPHCIGHHFWQELDPTFPRRTLPKPRDSPAAIEEVYRAIDREIGELIGRATPDMRVMVVATHGMGPLYHASWHLPEILDLLGYGRMGQRHALRQDRSARVNPWRLLKMALPGAVQYRIKAALPKTLQDGLLFLWYTGRRSWKGCRAFAVPNNDSVGAIRIAVKGRDRYGVVSAGEEYWRVCRDIADALRELTDPASGRPVVRRVTLTRELFAGPYLDQLPDLTVLWEQSFPWQSLRSPRFGTLRVRRQDARTGSHTPRGFLLAKGPGIPAGGVLQGASIYDIAPTVLQAAGVESSVRFDGRPLLSLSGEALATT
jgi:predicted AlkP superfamily phosphohydrolase/phosphomutase